MLCLPSLSTIERPKLLHWLLTDTKSFLLWDVCAEHLDAAWHFKTLEEMMSLLDCPSIQMALHKRIQDLPPHQFAHVVSISTTIMGKPFNPGLFCDLIDAYPPTPALTWGVYLNWIYDKLRRSQAQ